jgi:hypothetical protein
MTLTGTDNEGLLFVLGGSVDNLVATVTLDGIGQKDIPVAWTGEDGGITVNLISLGVSFTYTASITGDNGSTSPANKFQLPLVNLSILGNTEIVATATLPGGQIIKARYSLGSLLGLLG